MNMQWAQWDSNPWPPGYEPGALPSYAMGPKTPSSGLEPVTNRLTAERSTY